MPYTPDPLDATQPTEDKLVESAAAEFRALKTRIAQVAAAAQSGSQAVGGLAVPNQIFSYSTTNQRIEVFDTNPNNWNLGPSSMYVQFELVSNNFYAQNPNAHFAVILRCDTSTITTDTRGQGAVFGYLALAQEGSATNPCAQIETFADETLAPAGYRYLFPAAASAPGKPLAEGVRYRVHIESVVTQNLIRKIRLAVSRENQARSAYDLELDTGYVTDDNVYFDTTKQGLVFGAINTVPGAWSLDIQNIIITWEPAPTDEAAHVDRFSRFGGTISGPVSIAGALNVSGGDIHADAVNAYASSYIVTGATTPIGATHSTGLYNIGGSQAEALWDAPQDMEGLSSAGTIGALFGHSTPITGDSLEFALRPLYAYISVLIADLKARKVI